MSDDALLTLTEAKDRRQVSPSRPSAVEARSILGHRARSNQVASLADDLARMRGSIVKASESAEQIAVFESECRLAQYLWESSRSDCQFPFAALPVAAKRMLDERRRLNPKPPKPEPLPPKPGNVYFVGCGEFIKIGFTTDVPSRLSGLQTSSPHGIVLLHAIKATEDRERELHRRFKHLRERREWFRAEPELLAFIAELKAGTK